MVSTPAVSSERTTSGACSGVMSPRSEAAQMSAPKPSGASASRAALGAHPGRQLGHPGRALGDQVVGRAEGVERVVAVGQQVLPALRPEADGVREDPQRERLGQAPRRASNSGPVGQHLVDERVGVGEPAVAQPAQRPRGRAPSAAPGAGRRAGAGRPPAAGSAAATASRCGSSTGRRRPPDWNSCQSTSAACTCS